MKKNTKARNRRAQNSKPAKSGNQPYMEAMQELRRSNAAAPWGMATDYRRKPKHTNRGWDEN